MSNVRITTMIDDEIDEVTDVFLAVFNHVGEGWTREAARKHIKENFFDTCHFVARYDDKILGFIMAIPLTRENGREVFIDSIAVLPEYQHTGIGKMLWDTLNAYALENKCIGIRLLANRKLKSFDWYSKMGYRESGWIELFKEV